VSLSELRRLLRTLRYLRPGQMAARLRLEARRGLWSRWPERVEARYLTAAAGIPPLRFDHPGLQRLAELRCGRTAPDESLRVARAALEGRFEFLSVERDMGGDVDWYRADLDEGTRLWKTLLHEFPYAVDLARAHRDTGEVAFRQRFFELARGWRAVSPIARPGFARDCWNSRAVARRLLSWAVAGSLLRLEPADPDGVFLAQELAVHALFLRDNLEWDLRGNHLISDLTALSSAHSLLGCAPEAAGLLRAQLHEQILADGCHEERVPMYHAVALQELVETRSVLGNGALAWLDDGIRRMASFLAGLLPADGQLPLFGDSFHGEVDPRRVLEESDLAPAGSKRAAGAGPEVSGEAPVEAGVLAGPSGLVVLRSGSAHLVARGGAHGPDHQLGHAHCDGLSFELTLDEQRVITDTGTPTYDAGSLRERARSTAAHNTVQVDGQEQIEAWGSFRVGRRGRGRVVAQGEDASGSWVSLVHDGWRWLPGRPVHRRLIALSPVALVVLDTVQGSGTHQLRSALHLHPERPESARVLPLGGACAEISAPLHERFNETRQATEVFLEASAELPWVAGWLVLFDGGTQAPDVELHQEEGVVLLRRRHADAVYELRWRPEAVQPRESVVFSRCSSSEASAT
jgi:uncharacterized heparinase superfamily protein